MMRPATRRELARDAATAALGSALLAAAGYYALAALWAGAWQAALSPLAGLVR